MHHPGTYMIEIQVTPCRAAINLTGELDIAATRHLTGIKNLTAGCTEIVINLAGVTFCDSYAYESLAGYCWRMHAQARKIRVTDAPACITLLGSLLNQPLPGQDSSTESRWPARS